MLAPPRSEEPLRERAARFIGRAQAIGLTIAVLAVIAPAGCRRGVPVVDTAPKPEAAAGTISGTVTGPEGTNPAASRIVEVVNLATNELQRTTTNSAGGFTFKLPPGKYRVQLPLRDGERLIDEPDVIDLDRSDVDAHADFVLGTSRLLYPRLRAPRGDDGLGSAIA